MSQAVERYASTLFELASSEKKLDAFETEARGLIGVFSQSTELVDAMKSPLYSATDKIGVLGAIGKKLKISKTLLNFVSVVAQNGRTSELVAMLQAFLDKSAAARGAVKAQVETAFELDAKQLQNLKASLSSAFKAEVEIEPSVNPDLIGGLVVKIGSRLFDDSIKTKLDTLKNSLKGA